MKLLEIFKKNKLITKSNSQSAVKVDFEDVIEKVKLNSVHIQIESDSKAPGLIGTSKFGGRPDLPSGFEWYYFSGKSYISDEIKSRPLAFLAQINLEDVAKYDIENRLPQKGMLYFFYELDTMVWGFDPNDVGAAKVYYYDGDTSSLNRMDFPCDLEKEYQLPERKLYFKSEYNAPAFDELFSDGNLDAWEEYDDFLREAQLYPEENITKLLGYSNNIQGDMLLECELVSHGLYCGDLTGYQSPERKQLKKNRDQWKLLFQLDTVILDEFELMFGDCGRIYYFIKEEDLKRRDFNNTWLILQCS